LEKAFKDLETKKDWTKIMTKDDDVRVREEREGAYGPLLLVICTNCQPKP
jgi:hypothetical protein